MPALTSPFVQSAILHSTFHRSISERIISSFRPGHHCCCLEKIDHRIRRSCPVLLEAASPRHPSRGLMIQFQSIVSERRLTTNFSGIAPAFLFYLQTSNTDQAYYHNRLFHRPRWVRPPHSESHSIEWYVVTYNMVSSQTSRHFCFYIYSILVFVSRSCSSTSTFVLIHLALQ
jgi:hypothetical protein